MPTVTRLYDFFKPSHYQITLQPDARKLVFTGSTIIEGTLVGTSTELILHAKDLRVSRVIVNSFEAAFALNADTDELHISLPNALTGKITTEITFSGEITKPMHGIYPCTTSDDSVILATQFESHHAREAFPCVDEPEAKATFDLTLITPKEYVALSNNPPLSSKNNGEFTTHIFETTPIMSTYLLAFVVGDLHSVSAKTKNGTEVRVWASRDHAAETLEFALDTSVRSIEFFNEYFKTPYPLSKCDHIALPDFSSGAMENWGLITYREVCLIVDPVKTSTSTKEMVATVIAHELSHQWFGNLVTMQWWDDLWLNESFATLMEYICIDALFPDWDIMLTFASQEALSALWRDNIHGVQSVYSEVTHPDQISTLFDPSIVYAKGARLLLMARNYVGDEAFRAGLQAYFKKHSYKNTKGNDLWAALSDASGKDVGKFMQAWISQSGYPVLIVDQNGTELTLKQKRFLLGTNKKDSTLWPIPLGVKPKIGITTLREATKTVSLATDAFTRFNTLGSHYTVRYARAWQRKALAKLIADQDKSITPSQRLLVLNDSLMQAKNGISSIVDTLELLAAFANERQDTVWDVMSLSIADARRLVETNDDAEKAMKVFVFSVVRALYDDLGWLKIADEPLNDTKLRGTILALASYSEQSAVVTESLKQFQSYATIADMPADTRGILLAAAVKHGGQKEFDKLFALYPIETNSELQQDICGALIVTKNKQNIAKILNNITNQDFVRLQDVDRWIVYLLRNRWAREQTWQWLTSHWNWIEENFASDKSYDNYPRYAGSVFSTKEWQKAYSDFFTPKLSSVSLQRNIELGLKEIEARVQWRERDEAALVAWLLHN